MRRRQPLNKQLEPSIMSRRVLGLTQLSGDFLDCVPILLVLAQRSLGAMLQWRPPPMSLSADGRIARSTKTYRQRTSRWAHCEVARRIDPPRKHSSMATLRRDYCSPQYLSIEPRAWTVPIHRDRRQCFQVLAIDHYDWGAVNRGHCRIRGKGEPRQLRSRRSDPQAEQA